ncbi:hepatitis A virus cellular receptor 1-like isoform X2 [Phyllostomus hastatus]|uniref:hepatitis A virus cellular receptor 1-like isoform X2 n=1 Tax=Phyllostomus hastatus TaxID=9423 RepID=UPI001E6833C1|nr:hepatitis A virus cellular receptor 1-like isoform X2 [Phyllostomus hastatus]
MHSWVAFTGLLLLWTDAVVSQARVDGVAGQSVTLPCTYSTARGTNSMCWGRGACPLTRCPNELIWTDGHRITFQKSRRYNLKGMISQGNVSLTIEDAAQSDSGTYCCRVEYSGWFNDLKVNILLDVKPAPPNATSAPTSPRVSTSTPTTAARTQNHKTDPPKVTSVGTPTWLSPSAPTTPAPTPKLPTDAPKVTSVGTPPWVSPSAPTTPAPTPKLHTALPKATSAPTSPRGSTSAPTTPAPTPKLNTAPPKATNVPTSPSVSTSAALAPAHTQDILRETTSSSPMQTTGTQPITTQEANRTSSPSDPCPTDGNSTVMRPSEGAWPDGGNHVNVGEKPWMSTNKALYIGLAATALILLSVLAAVITKRHLCVKRKVLNISKPSPIELLTGTLPNDTAVHYQAEESVHLENNVYSGN